jgi:glucosamine 6-phosphate synthetase-like amidotransferase/phosphosugar isomerase protein
MKSQDVLIVHPETIEQYKIVKAFLDALGIKFESETYNPEFVAKVEESRGQYIKGEYISVEKKDIKSFLGLE